MRENRGRKLKLRPRLVTGITTGFMIVSTVVSSMAIINNSMNVKTIGNGNDVVKAMEEDPTANWDLNRVNVVYDPTGIPVPVPKGWAASGVESERYVNGLNVEKTGTLSNLTFTSSSGWSQNDDNVWVSENHGLYSTSRLNANEITVGETGALLRIECSVNSVDARAGLLNIYVNNIETGESEKLGWLNGNSYGSNYDSLRYATCEAELKEGRYNIYITYEKGFQETYSGYLDQGFVRSGTILNYDSEGNDSVTVHQFGGFVIYEGDGEINDSNAWNESQNRNQFVWVPVKDTSRVYETNTITGKKKSKLWVWGQTSRTAKSNSDKDTRVEPGILPITQLYILDTLGTFSKSDLQGYTREQLYKELQDEFDKTMTSIEKYGGFYIGRYEMGSLAGKGAERRLLYPASSRNWYNLYSMAKNISSNENIQINMIWGCLWDETLQWLIESGGKNYGEIVYSAAWGNFYKVAFSYINPYTGNTMVKAENRDLIIATGAAERNKANNIYDMAGNVADWTLEGYGSAYRVCRGGKNDINSGIVGASETGVAQTTDTYSIYGARPFFYIK